MTDQLPREMQTPAPVTPSAGRLIPLGLDEVRITGGFWGDRQRIKDMITLLHQCGIAVSLFIDPELEQIKAARRVECAPGCGPGVGQTNEQRFSQATRLRDCGTPPA